MVCWSLLAWVTMKELLVLVGGRRTGICRRSFQASDRVYQRPGGGTQTSQGHLRCCCPGAVQPTTSIAVARRSVRTAASRILVVLPEVTGTVRSPTTEWSSAYARSRHDARTSLSRRTTLNRAVARCSPPTSKLTSLEDTIGLPWSTVTQTTHTSPSTATAVVAVTTRRRLARDGAPYRSVRSGVGRLTAS